MELKRTRQRGRSAAHSAACCLVALLAAWPATAEHPVPPAERESVACGPTRPAPIETVWLEVPTPEDAAELRGTSAHLAVRSRAPYAVSAVLTATIEYLGETSRHVLGAVRLAAGETVTHPVPLAVPRAAAAGAVSTGFVWVQAEWLSADGERSGRASSPELYFFPRERGFAAFGEVQLRRRLQTAGDIPEARLGAHLDAQPGTQLEMAFDVRGPGRSASTITDETSALDRERRLRRQREQAAGAPKEPRS